MKKILNFLIFIIIFTAPITKYYLKFGFRLNYCELFAIIFIFLSSIYFYNKKVELPINLKKYILLQWFYLVPILLSLSSFIFILKSTKEIEFYLKGFVWVFVFLLFLTFFLLYLKNLSISKKKFFLKCILYSTLTSVCYGMIQILLFLNFQVDLDQIISNSIPFFENDLSVSDSALGFFFRLDGLTNDPSVQASFIIFPLFFVIYLLFELKEKFHLHFYILIIGLLLTMSGSSLTGVIFGFITLIILTKFKFVNFLKSIFLLIPFIILLFYFNEQIVFYLNNKLQTGGTTKIHADIAKNAFLIGLKAPIFGIGHNNIAYMFETFFQLTNYNSHNSWLNYFVELGIFGLFYRILLTLFILRVTYKSKSKFKYYFISAFIAINIASLGYDILMLFNNQLVITFMFITYFVNYDEQFIVKKANV